MERKIGRQRELKKEKKRKTTWHLSTSEGVLRGLLL
jgi:hypothetical protein